MTEIERTLEQIAEQQAKIQNIQATLNRNRRNIPPGMDTKKAERRRAEVMAAIQIGEMPEHALQEVESELLASRAQAEVENRAREEALSVIEALEGREKSAKQELEASKKRHRALILETLATRIEDQGAKYLKLVGEIENTLLELDALDRAYTQTAGQPYCGPIQFNNLKLPGMNLQGHAWPAGYCGLALHGKNHDKSQATVKRVLAGLTNDGLHLEK